jgi:hypothetical protein
MIFLLNIVGAYVTVQREKPTLTLTQYNAGAQEEAT